MTTISSKRHRDATLLPSSRHSPFHELFAPCAPALPASVACALLLMMGLALATGQVQGNRFNDTVYPLVFGLRLGCLAAALASCTPVCRHGDPGANAAALV